MNYKQQIEACLQHVLRNSPDVVIGEPYVPYIPNIWNGVIVLAESQNLSLTNDTYVQWLNSKTKEKKINRLNIRKNLIGVYPWDDGSIKIAVESALDIKSAETGVSNAVLWSQRGKSKQNVTPNLNLQEESSKLWQKLLNILEPKMVVCCGNIAQSVIKKTKWTGDIKKLRLPSKTAMSRVSGMFSKDDLLRRYPEVQLTISNHPEWIKNGYELNKIFFACHAVSQLKI